MRQERRTPAEVFPPGQFIKEELEARGWTQAELAEILGRPPQLVNEIVAGKRSITAETARGLGEAFGTGPEVWMNLDAAHQLWKEPRPAGDDAVARRARLYEKAPVKDMIRRQWIEPSSSVEVLEKRVLDFLEISDLDDEPRIWPVAARKSTSYESVSPAETAWVCRAKRLAGSLASERFTDARHAEAMARLRALVENPEEIRHVPRILAEAGVRLVVVELLPRMRLDGATLWLPDGAPVIALSMRFDRIDWFWFTLLHEMKHVANRDGLKSPGRLDVLFASHAEPITDKPVSERQADSFAAESLVPRAQLENFIARVRPLYSKAKIRNFATVAKVHPGIVVGQLQYRREIGYSHNREMLAKVRDIITSAALTDGWGKFAPAL